MPTSTTLHEGDADVDDDAPPAPVALDKATPATAPPAAPAPGPPLRNHTCAGKASRVVHPEPQPSRLRQRPSNISVQEEKPPPIERRSTQRLDASHVSLMQVRQAHQLSTRALVANSAKSAREWLM